MKKVITPLLILLLSVSCGIKISGTAKRNKYNIAGPSSELFKKVMVRGKILDESDAGNIKFILVQDIGNDNKIYFFAEQYVPRRSVDGINYRRKIDVFLLSDPTAATFEMYDTAVKEYGTKWLSIPALCKFINGSSIFKDFFLFEVFFHKNSGDHRGLFVEKVPCATKSRIIQIDDRLVLKNGYKNINIHCLPVGYDSLLRHITTTRSLFGNLLQL